MKNMRRKKAFTLIEILVVITIIVLLVAILLPSLVKVRLAAMRAVCSAHMHQVAMGLEMYEMHYKYKRLAVRNSDSDTELYWMGKLAKFVGDAEYGRRFELGETIDILLCPAAPESKFEIDSNRDAGNPRAGQWGTNYKPWEWMRSAVMSTIGSFTINGYITYDWYYEIGQGVSSGPNPDHLFRQWDTIGPEVPLFGDGLWTIGWPKAVDQPPPDLTGCTTVQNPNNALDSPPNGPNHMWRFCIDRHSKKINLIFKDLHIDSVKLEDLWHLQWHRGYQAPPGEIQLPSD